MSEDPYAEEATGVLRNKLGLAAAAELEAAEREITHAARAQRALFEQLAVDAGFVLGWQRLDADRNIAASAAIMRGDPAPMRAMLDELVRAP